MQMFVSLLYSELFSVYPLRHNISLKVIMAVTDLGLASYILLFEVPHLDDL